MTFPAQETGIGVRAAEFAVVRSLTGVGTDDDIVFDDEGWDSRVYVVDGGDAVFKFPRSPAVQRGYANEIAMLQLVEAEPLLVRTPRVRWVGPELAYFGYEGVHGHAPNLDDLTRHECRTLGHVIGTFAKTLHTLELAGVRVMTVEDEIADFQAKYDAAASTIAERFTRDERATLDEFYAVAMPEEMRRLGGDLVLCHGDLGPWNVMLAADGSTGVIDFGDVCRCDPSKDLVGMYEPVALDAALEAYGYSELLHRKVAVRAKALPAMDLIFYAGKEDEERLTTCIDRIRAFLAPGTR